MKNSYNTDHSSLQWAKICQLEYYKNIFHGKQGLNPSYQSPEQVGKQDGIPLGIRKLSQDSYDPAGMCMVTMNTEHLFNDSLTPAVKARPAWQ